MTPPPNSTDLITSKTAEFENLPGLVLGLDGWVLRSVPKHLRAQFLTGYEKLLRIVFHPDRYSEENQKQSRQVYLQAVGEAVRFMLADEFSYELTTDTVPTRRNPMVSLRNAVQVRDAIIARLDEEKNQSTTNAAATEIQNAQLKAQLEDLSELSEKRLSVSHRLRVITRIAVRNYPVPIGAAFCRATGYYLNFKECELLNSIARLSSSGEIGETHPWAYGDWVDEAKNQKLTEPQSELSLERGGFDGGRIVGAMTIAHLCEYLRHINDYGTITPEKALTDLKYISAPKPEEELEALRIKMFSFTLGFYASKMILLIQPHKPQRQSGNWLCYRFFAVESADAESGRVLAERDGLKKKCQTLTTQLFAKERVSKEHRSRATQLARELKYAQEQITELKQKLLDPTPPP